MKNKIEYRLKNLKELLDSLNKTGYDIDSYLVIDTIARIDELTTLSNYCEMCDEYPPYDKSK